MPLSLLEDLATRIGGALRPLAGPLEIRNTSTFQAKAAAPVAAGSSTLQLAPPAGMDRVMPGDTFTVGGPAVKTVGAEAAAAGGIIAAAFSPALTAPIAAGAAVPVTRTTTQAVLGWEEAIDVTRIVGTLIGATDTVVCILADSLAGELLPGATVVTSTGRALTIRSAARDGSGAVWRIVAGA